jgi:hypothetical protein
VRSVAYRLRFPHKLGADLFVWPLAPVVAYLVRFDGRLPAEVVPGLVWLVGLGAVAKLVALVVFRLHHQSWRHTSFLDTVQVVRRVERLAREGYPVVSVRVVPGAGGSIGSEFVRQLVQVGVARVVALGHGENSIFELMQGLARQGRAAPVMADVGVPEPAGRDEWVVPVIAGARDPGRIRQVFERQRPQVVFHAAAHKHVRFMEWSPEQAILSNLEGTRNVLAAASAVGVA